MKIRLLLLVLCLTTFSCGKRDTSPRTDSTTPVLTFNVPASYYNDWKISFDRVEAEITSKSGKQLVKFVPNWQNPKYATTGEALNYFNKTHEAWVLFKSPGTQFTDIPNNALGAAIVGTPNDPLGLIVINFSIDYDWNTFKFGQTLAHEALHCLGFDHTYGTDYSIMNYTYNFTVSGLTSLDYERLAEKFPFSIEFTTIKDLEKIGFSLEDHRSENYASYLVENFGLSEERGTNTYLKRNAFQ